MIKDGNILRDRHGREHNYLRISLTERCNLRCFYCMPEEGIELKKKEVYMSAQEIFSLAKTFVSLGVTKIRLTGGEPLVRKDAEQIIRSLSTLPVELCLTTNAILLDRFIPLLKEVGLRKLNISLDSLDAVKNLFMVKRDEFDCIMKNIIGVMEAGIFPKLNVVLIRGLNDNEIIPFIELGKKYPIDIRFIEFMPFNGNQWELERCVKDEEVLEAVYANYGPAAIDELQREEHYTARNYRVKGYLGSFGLISTVSKPFCKSCNRLRLTADGKLKNCLFGVEEADLLGALRAGEDVLPLIQKNVEAKKALRGGIELMNNDSLKEAEKNRPMIGIGG